MRCFENCTNWMFSPKLSICMVSKSSVFIWPKSKIFPSTSLSVSFSPVHREQCSYERWTGLEVATSEFPAERVHFHRPHENDRVSFSKAYVLDGNDHCFPSRFLENTSKPTCTCLPWVSAQPISGIEVMSKIIITI